jgi:hypothetical protein
LPLSICRESDGEIWLGLRKLTQKSFTVET